MRDLCKMLALCGITWLAAGKPLWAIQDPEPQEDRCIECHGTTDLWEGETLHLLVTRETIAADIHWQKGIRCVDCHGGNPDTVELREAHAVENGFRKVESPADLPAFCGHCHANAPYMHEFQPAARTDQVERFWMSVHGQDLKNRQATADHPAATCTSCHPVHAMQSAAHPQSSVHPSQLAETCGTCHRTQLVDLRKSVHSKAGEKNETGGGTLLDCRKCHGDDMHGLLPTQDDASPVYLNHQVQGCGGCHEEYLATYHQSVHGVGLEESGLVVTAVCADCHGAHGIYYAPDLRSSLHVSKVAATCGACHWFIEQRLATSVHGSDRSPALASDTLTEKRPLRKPSCTDCHQGHDQSDTATTSNRTHTPERCGNCHADYALRYRLSLHGELTHMGYEAAATCSDCHGAHEIQSGGDPASRLSEENRVQTCQQCHANATARFARFDPHANYKDAQRYPLLYGILGWTTSVWYLGFGLFAIHAVLWFTRSFVHTLKYGRHRRLVSEQIAVVRFSSWDRVMYVAMIVAFFGLVVTGVPLRYGQYAWAQRLAAGLGGFETTSVWHHFFGLLLLVSVLVGAGHFAAGIFRRQQRRRDWRTTLFGPESLIPNRRDVGDFRQMIGWFIGFSRKPTFEKWTYWEKLDYWALVCGFAILAGSGVVLWYPGFFGWLLSGTALNIAKMMHSELALLIGGMLFIMHVFNTHLRPEKFPLDLSRFTGLVDEEHLRSARPDYLERLRREGSLEEILTVVPAQRWLRTITLFAWSILATGLVLLAVIALASIGE
ncbi:MAG: hypothetical protein ACYC0X_22970 [Pirellulaceae bacterium]